MSSRLAVVIAVDGLRAAALGAYGNTAHPTPEIDALASESVVVDWMYRESPDLAEFYQEAWGGGALLAAISKTGAAVALVTDDADVAAWGDAAGFADVWRLESGECSSATDVSHTALARLFAVAAEQLERNLAASGNADLLLWIHSKGFHGPWDAPLSLRAGLLDEGDPAAPRFVDPPACEAVEDHDALLGFRTAYAAQTIVLDECLGGFLTAVGDVAADRDALIVLAGCRGFALGEHGLVGAAASQLFGELLHVPCLLRNNRLAPAPPRRSSLATPDDLGATLAAWFDAPHGEGADMLAPDSLGRQFVIAAGAAGERAIRTPEWFLRVPPQADSIAPAAQLYLKPDDRWEANEVADRCPDVAAQLLAALDRCTAAENRDRFAPLPELSDADSSIEPR